MRSIIQLPRPIATAAIKGVPTNVRRRRAAPSHPERLPDHANFNDETDAESRMRHGLDRVFGGLFLVLPGIVGYCVATLPASTGQPGIGLQGDSGWLAMLMLAVIGLGTALWVSGAFVYLSAASES